MQITNLVAVALLASVSTTALACEMPRLVIIPDQEAAAGNAAQIRMEVMSYWQAMLAYTGCIRAELNAAGGESAPSLTKAVLVSRNNVAVAEVEAVLTRFRASVGAIESPGPEPQPAN